MLKAIFPTFGLSFFPLYQFWAFYLQYWPLKQSIYFLPLPREGTTHFHCPDCLKAAILFVPSNGFFLLTKYVLL